LKHHNILFSDDYKKEFDTIFQELDIPIDPTIYISITKKTDDTHAPIGAENWFILLNMPYNSNKINWDVKKTEVRDLIIKKLKKFGFDIEDDIMFEQSITPTEMESMYLTNKGSIYGLSSNSKFSAFLRQSNRNKKIENLYHVGGSVHPGGGIPLVILSGKIASELVLSN
jgi:phytoene dehydrogenase-like protein